MACTVIGYTPAAMLAIDVGTAVSALGGALVGGVFSLLGSLFAFRHENKWRVRAERRAAVAEWLPMAEKVFQNTAREIWASRDSERQDGQPPDQGRSPADESIENESMFMAKVPPELEHAAEQLAVQHAAAGSSADWDVLHDAFRAFYRAVQRYIATGKG